MATYLEVVNKVLKRLREPTVATFNENTYSTLISELVNQAKREVEDAHNWTMLRTHVDVTTSSSDNTYTLTNAGDRARVLGAYNTTDDYFLKMVDHNWFTLATNTDSTTGQPLYYRYKGTDTGDPVIEVYPTPDGIYTLRFDTVVPQDDLDNGGTTISVPFYPVVLRTWSLAVSERGEDQGVLYSEIDDMYETALADAIAQDASRVPGEFVWQVD